MGSEKIIDTAHKLAGMVARNERETWAWLQIMAWAAQLVIKRSERSEKAEKG